MNKPELLAPAGTPEALDAAIEGGADAVYFGSTSFSCRMRAGNFDTSAMREAITKCRLYGVKSYITVNIRVRDGEMSDATALIDEIADAGADAVIMTDLALARYTREAHPDIELHASTQCGGATAEDARVLASLGFTRMVCPRELSAEQIKKLSADSPIGIEMFLHGAHCASYSGQCLASFAMGGRSGNRGECAQPCRLSYAGIKGDASPLSIKDMCLAGHIKDICSLGVASLKIEGRQKQAAYVYGVTKIYRRLLDEGRNATPDEVAHLARLFSRDGFTDGYYRHSYGKMTGVRSSADLAVSRDEASFEGLKKKVPLSLSFSLTTGERAKLTASALGHSVTVFGDTPTEAINQPLTADSARKNLAKLGSTCFALSSFTALIGEGLFLTPASLNAVRRDAVDAVIASVMPKRTKGKTTSISVINYPTNTLITAEFLTAEQITDEARAYFDEIYVPASEYKSSSGYGIALPPVMTDDDAYPIEAVKEAGFVLANTYSQLVRSLSLGARATASYRMNAFGKASADELYSLGASAVIASPEAPLGAVRAAKAGAVVYGRLPVMHLLRCPQASNGYCHGIGGYTKHGKKGGGYCVSSLTDRQGEKWPLIGYPDCVNVLYNAVPIYMADRQSELGRVNRLHFIFSTETPAEVDGIIKAYKKSLEAKGQVRRIR